MGRITPILRCQWRAFWRRFIRPGTLAVSNQGILLIISLLALVKYIRALNVTRLELSLNKTLMLEQLLLVVFLVWLFPLTSNSRIAINTRALQHLPLTIKELFTIKAASLFIPPYTWMILAGSFALAYPLSYAPNPIAGILAALLYIATSFLLGLTLAQLVSVAAWRKWIFLLLVGLLAVLVFVEFRGGQKVNVIQLLSISPAKLVSNPSLGHHLLFSFSLLVGLFALMTIAALWSFRVNLRSVDTGPQRKATLFSLLNTKTGSLSIKDLRYFRRLLDPYLGWLVSVLCCVYLLSAPQPSAEVFWIFIIIVFFPNAALTFNSFGLDNRSSLDRYILLPVSGREVMLSKNLAFVLFVALQLAPMMLLAIWQIGFFSTLLGIVEGGGVALAYMTWGNLIAITHRFKMEFFRFSSGGSPIDVLFGVIFGSLPGAILMRLYNWQSWWAVGVVMVLYLAMYWASLLWSGRKYERVRWMSDML
jgi:hypothetical protein